MYAVILAGGGGTRLWPLSTPERPKPFLPLLGDESLIQRTVLRLSPDLGPADVTVVTDRRYGDLVRGQLPGVAVLEEPAGRNTAAAIALAAEAVERPDDEVMAVLPADHVITDETAFRQVLGHAAELAEGAFGLPAPLVTLGIRVTRPATEYGYLLPDIARAVDGDGLPASPLVAFEEKPTPERATELMTMPGVAWNAGMFLWRRRAIREALARFAPDVHGPVVEGLRDDRIEEAYEAVRPTSIDYAVMEQAATAGQVVMAGLDVGWSDLGGWAALLAVVTGSDGVGGRVVPPGEMVEAGPDDLLVERIGGTLRLGAQPGSSIEPDRPRAILVGARKHEAAVAALLERCSRQEGGAS